MSPLHLNYVILSGRSSLFLAARSLGTITALFKSVALLNKVEEKPRLNNILSETHVLIEKNALKENKRKVGVGRETGKVTIRKSTNVGRKRSRNLKIRRNLYRKKVYSKILLFLSAKMYWLVFFGHM